MNIPDGHESNGNEVPPHVANFNWIMLHPTLMAAQRQINHNKCPCKMFDDIRSIMLTQVFSGLAITSLGNRHLFVWQWLQWWWLKPSSLSSPPFRGEPPTYRLCLWRKWPFLTCIIISASSQREHAHWPAMLQRRQTMLVLWVPFFARKAEMLLQNQTNMTQLTGFIEWRLSQEMNVKVTMIKAVRRPFCSKHVWWKQKLNIFFGNSRKSVLKRWIGSCLSIQNLFLVKTQSWFDHAKQTVVTTHVRMFTAMHL